MSRFVALFLIAFSCARAAASRGLAPTAPTPVCESLLGVDARPHAPLPPSLQQLADDLTVRATVENHEFVSGLREAVDQLVAQKRVTPDQAERLFGQRVLGQYEQIFLKYVVAELKARGFDDDGVVDFIMNFDLTYDPAVQVEFAHAVTKRMMVTINDSPSADNKRSLQHFLELADGFGVSREIFGDFRALWRHVRGAHDRALIYFILENIRNAGRAFNEKIGEVIESEKSVATAAPSGWGKFLALVQPAPPVVRHRETREVARELFHGFEVPAFVSDVTALDLNPPAPPSTLERFAGYAAFSRVPAFLERLELSPPHVWGFLLSAEVPYLSADDLARLSEWREYPRVGADARALVAEELRRFGAMTEVARVFAGARRAEDDRLAAERRARKPDQRAIGTFRREFDECFQRKVVPTGEDIVKCLVDAHVRVRGDAPDLGGASFLGIAEVVFDYMIPRKNGFWASAVLEGLQKISRDYVLDEDKTRLFLKRIANYRFQKNVFTEGDFPLHTFDSGMKWLEPTRWGRDPEPAAADDVPPVERMRQSLIEFRSFLTAEESARVTDEVLAAKMIEVANRGKPASFLRVGWK